MRFWASMISILLIDQLTKYWIAGIVAVGDSIRLIGDIVTVTYVHNRGAAFGLLQGQAPFFLIMALLVTAGMIYYHLKYSPPCWIQYACGLIVGGALGNVIDRWVYGSVRDFISVGWWPVFNVADTAIVCGGALLMIYVLLSEKSELT